MKRRRGRRPGKQDTKKAILAAAGEVFAEHGYDGASVRQIATKAEVDPAMIHHYFGSKQQLFLETVRPPVDPAEIAPRVLEGDVNKIGERAVATFLSVWEHPVTGPMFEAMFRGAFASGLSAKLVREFFAVQIMRRIAKELTDVIERDEVPLRANLAASQLFGMASLRYILKFEPLASASHDEVVAAVAPTIQRYLTGQIRR